MEKHFKTLFLILSFSSCYGDLGELSGLLIGAHQQIHKQVVHMASAVLGQVSHHHRHPPPPPNQPAQTIVVLVEETEQGGQPQRPHGIPQQGQYPPNGQHSPNGYNQGYNQNTGYRPNHGYQYNPPPNPQINYGRGPYQNGQSHAHSYENGNSGHHQHIPNYNPNQHGQHGGQTYNQNGQGNNNVHYNNVNPNNDGYGNPNNVMRNNPNPNGNVVKNIISQEHNGVYQAENTKKPEEDGPLFVPLTDYTYGGDKIVINPPKRDTDIKKEEDCDDFPIDIRFKDE